MTDDKGPLHGIRVIELSHMIMGPSCGMFLAFLGAEVIKIEPPGGDKTRDLTGMGKGFFPTFNRAKKSVTLDLKSEAGRAVLDQLLDSADILVENFRDESLTRSGLSPEALRARHPQLIVTSCKGFLTGPYQSRTAMDEVVQMMTGMAHMTGPTGRPLRIGSSANDIMGGLFGAFSALAALMQRQQSGEGKAIRVGLFENCLLLVAQHMVQFDLEGVEAPPMPERTFSWPVYDIFETADGTPLFVGSITQTHWTALCDILELGELKTHPELDTRMKQIHARDWTLPKIAAAIRARNTDDLSPAFEAAGIPFAPVNRPAQMYDDPHVLRPGGLQPSQMPGMGPFRAPALPVEFDGGPVAEIGYDVPDTGADTDAVLSALGLSGNQIAAARGERG